MTTPRRRNLVVVRAGDNSLHPAWTEHLESRSWDLTVSYFGKDPDRHREPGATRIDDAGQKWIGLHALLVREPFWREYEYIWLPDDDLAISQRNIDAMFARMVELGLALAQPALSWGSYFSHRITLAHPSFAMRYTNFVEVMAPCFSRAMMERCLPTFEENLSGWGIDHVWPRAIPPRPRAIAILDAIEMTHTRPVGGPSYDRLREAGMSAHEELDAVWVKYQLPDNLRALVYGAIDRDGNAYDAGDPVQKAELARRLFDDRAKFDDAVAQNIIRDGKARSTTGL